MRQGTKSLSAGVAALLSVLTVGCGDDKTTIISGRHLITDVQVEDTGTDVVPADATDAAGNPITIEVLGDEYLDRNVEVRLVEDTPGTFEDPAVDPRVEEIRRTGARYIEVPHTRINQSELEFTLPASPLAVDPTTGERTGRVRVQVIQRNKEAELASTDANVLTYVTSTALSGGLSGSLSRVGDGAAGFATIFPGQSGIHMRATISNFTGEDVTISAVNSESINFGSANAALLDFTTADLGANPVTIANGAQASFDFIVAATEDLLNYAGSSIGAVVSFNAIGANTGQNRGAVASGSLGTAMALPTIQAIGGSVKSTGGGATAGAGGDVDLTAAGSVHIGDTSVAITVPAFPGFAGAVTTDQVWDDDTTTTADETFAGDLELDGITVDLTDAGGDAVNDDVIIVDVAGDFIARNVTFQIDRETTTTAAIGETLTLLEFRVTGSIYLENVTFDLAGSNRLTNDGESRETGASLALFADSEGGNEAATVTLVRVTYDGSGGAVYNGDGGDAGSFGIDADFADGVPTGVPGNVTLSAVTVTAVGGQSASGTGGAGGSVGIFTGPDTAGDSGDIAVTADCLFDLRGGGNAGPNATAANDGGDLAVEDVDANDTDDDGGDIVFYGRAILDGGDYDGSVGGSAGDAGSASFLAGGDLRLGDTTGNTVIITNGGSGSIPGGLGSGNAGADAGNVTVIADDNGSNGADNNVVDDGEMQVLGSSAIVAIGGGADASGGGTGGTIVLDNVQSEGVGAVVNTMAGTLISQGGWVHLNRTTAGGGGPYSAGDGEGITFNVDGDIAISGAILSLGGHPALEQGFDLGTNLVDEIDGGGTGTINVSTGFGAASTFDGDLVVSGVIASLGGGAVGDDDTGNNVSGGSSNTVNVGADGDGVGLHITSSGVVLSQGGPLYYGFTDNYNDGAQSFPGSAGTVNIANNLGETAAADSPILIEGLVDASGGWFVDRDNWLDIDEATGLVLYGDGGDINVDSSDDVGGNDGDVTIAGTLRIRGDGGSINVRADQGDTGSASTLLVSGSIITEETSLDSGNGSTIFLRADEGDLEIANSGEVRGRVSLIDIIHDDSATSQTRIAGLVQTDHRGINGAGNQGINVESGASVAGGDDLLITGSLISNAGFIDIDHTNTGDVVIDGATIDASAFENPVLARNNGNDTDGGDIAIGDVVGDTDQIRHLGGSVLANGVEILDADGATVGLGQGGTILLRAADVLVHGAAGAATSVNAPFEANGATQTGTTANGFRGGLGGGNIDFVAGQNDINGVLIVNTSGGIEANGGTRGDGGSITFDGVDGGLTLAAATTASAVGGNSDLVDPQGQVLDGAGGGSIFVSTDDGAVDIDGSFDVSGGSNRGGPGGQGGTFGVNAPDTSNTTVDMTGSVAADGGSSNYSAGLGGDGGEILFGDALDAAVNFDGASLSVDGGNGTSVGGDAGLIVVDTDTNATGNNVIDFIGTTFSLVPGTGSASGQEGLVVLDEGDANLTDTTGLTITPNTTPVINDDN